MHRIIQVFGALSLCATLFGCVSVDYVKKLDSPVLLEQASSPFPKTAIKEPTPAKRYEVNKSCGKTMPDNACISSIGDLIFQISIYQVTDLITVAALAPVDLNQFPVGARWMATHVYDRDGVQANIYTSPEYYNGNIGVILNSDYKPETSQPIIQLAGNRKGRRWRLAGPRNFFGTSTPIEAWGIRYGGKQGGDHVIEIIDKKNASTTEIIQTVRITDKEFSDGTTIKGARIKLLSAEKNGVIRCSVDYIRNSMNESGI